MVLLSTELENPPRQAYEHEATCNLTSWSSSIMFVILYKIYKGNHSQVNKALHLQTAPWGGGPKLLE